MRLQEIARHLEATLEGDGDVEIRGVAPIEDAAAGDLTFVASPRYRRFLDGTRASAVVLGLADAAPSGSGAGRPAVLRVAQPYAAFVRVLGLFDRRPRPAAGIHPTAVVAASATVGEGASIGPYVVVGEGASIGPEAVLHPHAVIYPGARIGRNFTAHAGSVVREDVRVGDHVVLQPGAVLGGDGFGFLPMGKDLPVPIPQVGGVRVEDHVEVGSNTTVDRATVGDTVIGRGAKLDNLVMVGHGSRIGAGSMLAGQAGMAGSTRIGERVLVGGQAGFAGHLQVGDDAQVAARAGVVADVEAGSRVAGMPAGDLGRWRRMVVALAGLPDLVRRVRRLERLGGIPGGPAGTASDDEPTPGKP